VFPTLGDLYDKIEPVVRSYRYDPKIAMDVTAGLKARIGSLRIGGKGLMLDTRQSVPWAQLLGRPTVLELEGVGDDEEKAFIIALLLMVLYEYRRTQSSQPSLQHVTVVEEAHRLLKRTSTDSGSSESANPAGKAVESFANMLAEIRSYGQGFLIADQIPNKLAVEVIKNTNLKILHRVVAEDDRQVMGGAMNLDGEQLRDVSTLTVGRALIYAEGMVSPYLVQVDFDKSKQVAAPATRAASDQAVQTLMQGFRKARVYDRFTACAQCPVRCDPAICDLAEDLLEAEGQSQAANGYVFGAVFDGEAAIRGYFQLQRRMERLAGRQLSADRLPILMHCLLVHAVDLWIERRGAHYRWLFPAGGELKQRLTALLVRLARDLRNDAATVQRMKTEVVPHLERLRGTIEQLCAVATGPFAGCSECQHRCWFAPEVAELARDDALHRIYDRALDADDPIPAVRRAAETAAAQLVPAAGLRDALARCFVVQKLQSRRAPDAAQLVRTIFEEKKKRKAGSS
jgi:hypothetical protein